MKQSQNHLAENKKSVNPKEVALLDTNDTDSISETSEEKKTWQESLLQEVTALRQNIESLYELKDNKEKVKLPKEEKKLLRPNLDSLENKDIVDQIINKEQKFKQQYPDYEQAASFFWQKRDKELQLWGIKDRAARDQIISDEIINFAKVTLTQGDDPAEKMYTIAKAWGYMKSDTAKLTQPFTAALSLSNLPGSSHTSSSLSPESLMAMDDKDFNRYWQKIMR